MAQGVEHLASGELIDPRQGRPASGGQMSGDDPAQNCQANTRPTAAGRRPRHRRGARSQTVARRFPALGFERQRKVAAMDFFASILRSEGPVLGETIADFRGLASLDVVRPEGARRFMRTAWGQSARELGMAWNLVNMEVWVRQQIGLD